MAVGGGVELGHVGVGVRGLAGRTDNGMLTLPLSVPDVPVRVIVALLGVADALTESVNGSGEQSDGRTSEGGETVMPAGTPPT